MSASLVSEDLLSQFNRFITTHMGLRFTDDRLADLKRGLEFAAKEFGFEKADDCMRWLMASPLTQSQIEILASHLTVGETYFFRDKSTMEALETQILPDLIRAHRDGDKRLRIWSAGCCTGEEPYTLAIMLLKMLPDIASWNITILGTDINPKFLRKASEGVYGEWSFRGVPLQTQDSFFKKLGEKRFELLPEARKHVTFSYLNLAEDAYPSYFNHTHAMDIIFCQNVLMYLTEETSKRIIHNFHRCLVDGGWLFVGPSENAAVLSSSYTVTYFRDAIFYKKSDLPGSEQVFLADPPPELEPLPEPVEWLETPSPAALPDPTIVPTLAEEPSPESAPALSMARLYADQGKLKEALDWSRKAVNAEKLSAGAYYLHATILQEQGALDEAASAFKRALYLDPNFVLALFALGNLSRQRGRLQEANRYWENCSALLRGYREEDILPESEGVTAGRLAAFLDAMGNPS